MPRHTSSSLSFSAFSRTLAGLAVTTTLGCAGTVTPPDSTPVYAEEIAPGVEPVDVEMQSTNAPEVKSTSPAHTTAEPSEPTEPDTEVEESKAETAAPAKDETDSTEDTPASDPPPAQTAPPRADKTSPKKKTADDEGGCGAGTCG